MTDIVLLVAISFSWIIFSWLVIYFHKKMQWYILPYSVFQLGATLLVYSITFVKGWAGIAYGSIGLLIISISLFLLLIVKLYYRMKYKGLMEETEYM
ncbi:hypothetical protein ACSVDE_17315 [Pseudalkalibacillus sp. Hm43]|uniref:hypothetical protein n=1 Tax=Pseudalkalibacillus sp. Hm43 TaxID=3450742 RepID=UPI003F4430BB